MRSVHIAILLAGILTATVLIFTVRLNVVAAHRHLHAQAVQVYRRLPAAAAE